MKVSGKPSQYDDLQVFIHEQEVMSGFVEASILETLRVDISDDNVTGAVERIADWMEQTGGLAYARWISSNEENRSFHVLPVILLQPHLFRWPFIILYFQELGFSGAQIGLLAGMAPLVTMVGAPLWTGLADAKGRHKLIMSLTILGAVGVRLHLPLTQVACTDDPVGFPVFPVQLAHHVLCR